jgi:hypothetical protein
VISTPGPLSSMSIVFASPSIFISLGIVSSYGY